MLLVLVKPFERSKYKYFEIVSFKYNNKPKQIYLRRAHLLSCEDDLASGGDGQCFRVYGVAKTSSTVCRSFRAISEPLGYHLTMI